MTFIYSVQKKYKQKYRVYQRYNIHLKWNWKANSHEDLQGAVGPRALFCIEEPNLQCETPESRR